VQLLDARLPMDSPAVTLSTYLDILPTNQLGTDWHLAVTDSSTVAPGLGTVMLAGDFGALSIGIPFPLAAGQTVPVTTDPGGPPTNFQYTSGSSNATAWVNTCTANRLNCELQAAQTVQGTLAVVQTAPLILHVNLSFFDPTQSTTPVITVSGTLSFTVEGVQTYCKSSDG
jgi:hypothetical protein